MLIAETHMRTGIKRAGYDIRDSAEWVYQQLLPFRVANLCEDGEK